MITIMWLAFVIQIFAAIISIMHAIWDRQQRWLYIFRGSIGWFLCGMGFASMAVHRALSLYNYYTDHAELNDSILSLFNSCVFLLAVIILAMSERKLKTEYRDITLMTGRCKNKAQSVEDRLS